MPQPSAELVKGTLDLLILRTLDLGAMHGSAIADRIAQVTKGTFQVKAGSLFPALHRLEPVSYTHLDVYKRQVPRQRPLCQQCRVQSIRRGESA